MNSNNAFLLSKLQLDYGGHSLTGRRKENQDAFTVNVPSKHHELVHKGVVACIADGVSCSEHSQKASQTAVMQFIDDYYATPHSWSIKHSANKILHSLNTWLFEQGAQYGPAHNGLVTTFSCLIIKSNTAHLFHVGDTRIYLLRGKKLQQLTRDHQRINFGKTAYLTRALGMDSSLDVDYQSISLEPGDRFLMTTDGLHDYVAHGQMEQMLSEAEGDYELLCHQLCKSAYQDQSHDNITCLAMNILQLPDHSQLEYQQNIVSRAIPPALKEGNVLEGFEVENVLHAGTRSHVYLVNNQANNQHYVLKTPSQNDSDDIGTLKLFANEYWVASQLSSERIMRMYPTPADSQFLYQVCEYIEGVTLRQWMYDNPKPSLQQVRLLLDEIVKALRVFQRAEMVHRDLKPENIMVTDSGSIKIIDFGSVKSLGLDEIEPENHDSVPLGALNYIAPEYINAGVADTVSDLFSVAVIGYEMLTGELPYQASSNQSLQSARHTNWHYRPISEFRDDIPAWVDLALKKGTHHIPARRYDVLSEFVLDLYTPNQTLQKELKDSPLIKRNPLIFWKLSTAVLALIVMLQWVAML